MKIKVEVDLENTEDLKTLDSGEPVILNAGTPQAVVLYPTNQKKCEDCDEKSYAAAEVESENEDKIQSLLKFVRMRQGSCADSLKNYVGSNKSQAEKFMAGLYRKEIAVYDDVMSWAQFFLGVELQSEAPMQNISKQEVKQDVK